MPLVSPVTVMGLALPVAVMPPGDAVTVYELMAAPFDAGAVKLTLADPSPREALTPVGAPGTVAAFATVNVGEE